VISVGYGFLNIVYVSFSFKVSTLLIAACMLYKSALPVQDVIVRFGYS
jgi:hypothetical protein